MKLKSKLTTVLVAATLLLIDSANANEALPMSAQQINKLQQLFPNNNNAVPEFQLQQQHEHVIWNQTPIDITLPVNKERMVSFTASIAFGYDKSILGDDSLKIQNNNGTLYLTAKKEFSSQRVEVKCVDTGQIILLNLSAKQSADITSIDVVMAKSQNDNQINANIKNNNDPKNNNLSEDNFSDNPVSYITITRFAAQQLYAPKRLLVQPPNIYRTPMHTQKAVPLFLDDSVTAKPLASWRGGDLFVTAVLLKNNLKQTVDLDPRNICGSWQAASFFPNSKLDVTGSLQDSTTLFLISNRPFNEAMQACVRGY